MSLDPHGSASTSSRWAPTRAPAPIRLERIARRFGAFTAVDGIDLQIEAGEFFSLLGPSGCGKTTTLRMIAGFEVPDEGRILVGDRDLTHVPIHRRDMGMVFQSYALFPHRTVAENVAFGLRMRGVGRAEIDERVRSALKQMRLDALADRRPSQLSGGQQQRVALARAIVFQPPVLLCDEPLGALDRKLRHAMQAELKDLQRSLGVTLVFVTHDQEEALTMSDRIGVMNAGRLEQVGAPAEIYDRPRTRFVADFIGDINLIEGRAHGGRFSLAGGRAVPAPAGVEGAATLALRPERLTLSPVGEGALAGTIVDASFLGDGVIYTVDAGEGMTLRARERNVGDGSIKRPGMRVGIDWRAGDAVVVADAR